MNTAPQHGDPERKEGLGGRVRRFVDRELDRVLDKEDRSASQGPVDHPHEPDRTPESDRTTVTDTATVSDRVGEPGRAADRESVTTHSDDIGRAGPAMTTTASAESGYDPDPPRDDSVDKTGTATLGRSSDQTAADAGAERVGLLNDPASLRDQWQQLQGTFVDDPQRAVREASELVERTLQEIHANVTRGPAADPTSTEDLRVSFQRYREFFQRLLSA
ncbi:MAG: hypothetical protein ACRDRG_15170 [Pseudonocardiaceae bacterium]